MMMKTLIIILVNLALTLVCQALSITWDANAPIEAVTSYKVYKVRHGNTLVATVTAPTVTLNVTPFMQGNRTQFYVTAVNAAGESVASARVTVVRH